jgi:ABC-type nitrate/sulfonate/bicarbonate transport system ATPase subunit
MSMQQRRSFDDGTGRPVAYALAPDGGLEAKMQRVALARALVNLPEVLLMDEPFGALDAHTKIVMQEELATIFKTQLTTTVMVTYDVEEAIYLSDAILIMSGRPGRLIEFIEVDLKKPRDRSDQAFVALRFDILCRAFGGPAPVHGFRKASVTSEQTTGAS